MTTTNAAQDTAGSAPAKKIIPNVFLAGKGTQPAHDEAEDSSDTELVILPDPVGHHMLVALPTMREMTKGGVIIPHATNERERAAAVVGTVLAQGSECYLDRQRFPKGAWCKTGDRVLFNRYAGNRFKSRDATTGDMVEYRILNDDEVTATIPDGAVVEGL